MVHTLVVPDVCDGARSEKSASTCRVPAGPVLHLLCYDDCVLTKVKESKKINRRI